MRGGQVEQSSAAVQGSAAGQVEGGKGKQGKGARQQGLQGKGQGRAGLHGVGGKARGRGSRVALGTWACRCSEGMYSDGGEV